MEPSESYETLEEHVKSFCFAMDGRRMNKTDLVLCMTDTEGENSVSNRVT